MDPLVSILIPCYNAGQWITDCVESALDQSYPNTEVILVDDGSTDNSWNLLQAYADRVQLHRQKNLGGNAARNRLLELAGGEWLQYLDADDWLGEDKVSRQLAELSSLKEPADLIYGEVQIVEMSGDQPLRPTPSTIEGGDVWEHLVKWQLPQTGAPLWRKAAVEAVGGWKIEQPCCQEHELYLRLLKGGKSFYRGQPTGAYYRQWSEGTVCKRNQPLVHEKRMEIVMQARHFLDSQGSLTEDRRRAMCQAVFETARSVYQYDRQRAAKLYRFIRGEMPDFRPTGPAAPPGFRLSARLFGYLGAEAIAAARRKLS